MYNDIYIKNTRHHKDYDGNRITNNNIIDILIAKIQNVIFTNKGEVLGDPEFGCSVRELLWQTNLDAASIKKEIHLQILMYVPEIVNYEHEVDFYIIPGTIEDIGVLIVDLKFTKVSAMFK